MADTNTLEDLKNVMEGKGAAPASDDAAAAVDTAVLPCLLYTSPSPRD